MNVNDKILFGYGPDYSKGKIANIKVSNLGTILYTLEMEEDRRILKDLTTDWFRPAN